MSTCSSCPNTDTNWDVDEQYLALCRRVLFTGKQRGDRTGVGTISLFGERLDIDLAAGFPLLTTKRVFWKGVLRELLWFISGSTDSKILAAQGVHIWDGNSSREYLDAHGLESYPEGEIGPGYGWQWRSFGGSVDQLAAVIKNIREKPTDRRHIVTAWNPVDLPKMALPPCHILYQFYVDDETLSCQMYQRSCDVGLGLPFNIASYALLTHMVAHVCGLRVGRLILCLGDTHIYTNHLAAIREQVLREPKSLPTLSITKKTDNIDEITEADIELTGYAPHPPLANIMPMAA
jgi:thymidylate synthase